METNETTFGDSVAEAAQGIQPAQDDTQAPVPVVTVLGLEDALAAATEPQREAYAAARARYDAEPKFQHKQELNAVLQEIGAEILP